MPSNEIFMYSSIFFRDYVTEKLSIPLQYFVVPVVLGAANYSQMAPPHSYINALDFKAPKQLAKYLIHLSQNKTEYLNYFKWKGSYSVSKSSASSLSRAYCKLCKILHEPGNHTKRRQTVADWWAGDGICKTSDYMESLQQTW